MEIITLNNNSLSSVTSLPAGVGGKVLQVVSTAKTNGFGTTSSSLTDITGLSVAITPSSSSNKINETFWELDLNASPMAILEIFKLLSSQGIRTESSVP